ncbi:hypothetical protein ACTXHA_04020 [Burkholderia cenocepacia]
MKRSTPLQRRTPLRSSGMKRKTLSPFSGPPTGMERTRRTGIKNRIRKPTVAEGSKYLAACYRQPCYLNVCCPWTDWPDPTVVPCHSNQSKHGKGTGKKADHRFTVPGCYLCHAWLDQGPAARELKVSVFDSALARWEPVRARKMGLGEVAE